MQQTANEADQPKFAGLAQTLNQSAASVRGLAAADKPVLQLRLIELFEATAAVAGSSLTAFNLDVGRLLHLLRVQAACVGDLSVPAAHPASYTWFPYAQAQLAIRAAASSPQAALLLLGPHPIEEEHLRPVQEAAAALHSTATLIMQRCAAKPEPPATWLLYDLAGAIGSDYDMAAQSIRALHAAACSAEGPTTRGMRTAFLPLQLASWDAAALPAELQPYAAHFRAALSLWLASAGSSSAAAGPASW